MVKIGLPMSCRLGVMEKYLAYHLTFYLGTGTNMLIMGGNEELPLTRRGIEQIVELEGIKGKVDIDRLFLFEVLAEWKDRIYLNPIYFQKGHVRNDDVYRAFSMLGPDCHNF